MTSDNIDAVKTLAPDLRTDEPRSPSDALGGFPGGLRALDKCRASLAGTNGEFQFNCPMDQRFFRASGIDSGEFQKEVASGATDEQMESWVRSHATVQQ